MRFEIAVRRRICSMCGEYINKGEFRATIYGWRQSRSFHTSHLYIYHSKRCSEFETCEVIKHIYYDDELSKRINSDDKIKEMYFNCQKYKGLICKVESVSEEIRENTSSHPHTLPPIITLNRNGGATFAPPPPEEIHEVIIDEEEEEILHHIEEQNDDDPN